MDIITKALHGCCAELERLHPSSLALAYARGVLDALPDKDDIRSHDIIKPAVKRVEPFVPEIMATVDLPKNLTMAERDAEIVAAIKSGASSGHVARLHNLTRERIRQIARAGGVEGNGHTIPQPARNRAIAKAYKRGDHITAIAAAHKISPARIYQVLRSNGAMPSRLNGGSHATQ